MSIKVVASRTFLFSLFTFAFSLLLTVFSITSLFTEWLNFLKHIRTICNSPTSKTSTFVFQLFKLVGTLTNLLMSSLSVSAFNAIKHF